MLGRDALTAGRVRDADRSAALARSSLTTGQALAMVAVISAAAVVVNILLALELPAPWSLPDELIYSEMAKSLAEGMWPSVRDEPTTGYGVLYPLLIAPSWALFDDPAEAYVAAKVINAVAMGLAVFPAFFLARLFVEVRSALAVAGFSVFVPSMLYAGSLLTEVVLYPVLLLALLGIATAVRRPTVASQVLAVAGIGLACLAKPLAVVLVPTYLAMVLHLGLLDRRDGGSLRARLREHSTAIGFLAGIAVAGVAAPAVMGDPTAALGSYGVVLGHVDPGGTLVWFVRHLAGLDLYVAIAPFAASLLIVCLGVARGADRRTRELAVLLVWTLVGLVLAVAAYASKPSAGAEGYAPTEARLHERNLFAVAPLLLIGLALYLERGRPGSRRLTVACLGVSALLPVLLPLERLVHNANLQALALIPWSVEPIIGLWPFTLAPLSAAACLVLAWRRWSSPVLVWALVGVVFGVTTVAAHASQAGSAVGRSTVGVGAERRWIDDAVPPGSVVVALWSSPGEGADLGRAHRTIWMNEFYNRAVGRIVEIDTTMPYALPHENATSTGGTLADETGAAIRSDFVLAPCWIRVHGSVVAEDTRTQARLYRVAPAAIGIDTHTGPAPACIRG